MTIITSDPLSLGQTLGALLTSVIDAQAQAARATVEFIEEVGPVGEAVDPNSPRELQQVAFTYRKFDENFDSKNFVLEVPLLSMVDIPLLTVKSAKFSFSYQVTTTAPPTSSSPATPAVSSPNPGGAASLSMYKAKRAQIVGTVVKSKDPATETTAKGGLDVVIEIEKAPLPAGLDRILEMLELSSTDTKKPDDS